MNPIHRFLLGKAVYILCVVLALLLMVSYSFAQNAYILDGLFQYGKVRPMDPVAKIAKEEGFTVYRQAHTKGKRLRYNPRVYLGHSMGGNAALKAGTRLKKNPPWAIITLDPGRRPLFSTCPKPIPCLNIYDPWNPIGGQWVYGETATNVYIPFVHSFAPSNLAAQAIIRARLRALKQEHQ